MPTKGTTRRSVRVEDDLWDKAKEAAHKNSEDLSEVIRRAIMEYVEALDGPGMSEAESIRKILLNEDNYTYADWTPEVDVEAMTEALASYVLRVKAYSWNEGHNAAIAKLKGPTNE
jgi:hypothetical protein